MVVLAYFRAVRTEKEWAIRSGGATDARGNVLLAPLKQLFDYKRVKDVASGDSATIQFTVTANAFAETDEASGDRVSEPGAYELVFEDGSGRAVQMAAAVGGRRVVLDPFTSDRP